MKGLKHGTKRDECVIIKTKCERPFERKAFWD